MLPAPGSGARGQIRPYRGHGGAESVPAASGWWEEAGQTPHRLDPGTEPGSVPPLLDDGILLPQKQDQPQNDITFRDQMNYGLLINMRGGAGSKIYEVWDPGLSLAPTLVLVTGRWT